MKLLIIAIIVILSSCGVRKDGCGTENYKRPFRVMRITDQQGGRAIVHLRRYQQTKTILFECLPDSIEVGKYLML
jgi:hypothetical protein